MKLNKEITVNQLLALGVDMRAIYAAIVKDLGGDETGFTYNKGDSVGEMPILPSWDEFMADGEWRHHICEVRVNLPVAVVPSEEIPQFQLSRGFLGYTGKVRIFGVHLINGLVKVVGMNEARYNALNFYERCKVMDIDRQSIHAVARLEYNSPYEMGTWRLTVCDLHYSLSHKFHRIREEVERQLRWRELEKLKGLTEEFFEDAFPELSTERYASKHLRLAFRQRDLLGYAPNGADLEELFFLSGRLGIDFQSL